VAYRRERSVRIKVGLNEEGGGVGADLGYCLLEVLDAASYWKSISYLACYKDALRTLCVSRFRVWCLILARVVALLTSRARTLDMHIYI
jgi:hypothetical protein